MEGITPTYNLAENAGGMGMGSGMWIFALLILALLFNGGFGGNNALAGRTATVEDLNNSANFTRLENQVANNGSLVERKTDAINNGICELGYTLARDFGAIQLQNAQDVASINAVTTTQTQKILDAMAQNKIESLQAQISNLQLQNSLAGVVRYPSSYVYASGCNPFCTGCGCGNSNI